MDEDIILEMQYGDQVLKDLPIVKFAAKYDIPIGKGTVAIALHDIVSVIDPDIECVAQRWSGNDILQRAKKHLTAVLKSYNAPTNMVLFLHRNSSDISLSEVADLVEILRSYNSNILFGYDDNASSNKLVAIAQAL